MVKTKNKFKTRRPYYYYETTAAEQPDEPNLSTCYTRRNNMYARGRVSTVVAGSDRKDTDTVESSDGVGGRTDILLLL